MTPQRAFDRLMALSLWSWAVLGLTATPPADRATLVRLTIAAVHAVVGWLFWRRGPLRCNGPWWTLAAALPALLITGWATKNAAAPAQWLMAAQVLFAGGASFALIAFCSLGKSFAILPALRGVVISGPYGWIRHPAYFGELIMLIGCTLASSGRWAWAPLIIALPLIVLRVLVEEYVLMTEPRYVEYARTVRWRLAPGVW